MDESVHDSIAHRPLLDAEALGVQLPIGYRPVSRIPVANRGTSARLEAEVAWPSTLPPRVFRYLTDLYPGVLCVAGLRDRDPPTCEDYDPNSDEVILLDRSVRSPWTHSLRKTCPRRTTPAKGR